MSVRLQHVFHSMFVGPLGLGMSRLSGSMSSMKRSAKEAPGRLIENSADVVKNTAGPVTLTADELKTVMYTRDCNGADRTDTTPTAALIVQSVPKAQVDDYWYLYIYNNGGANTLTLQGGSGVTVTGTATVAFGKMKKFRVKITNPVAGSEAVTILSLGADSTI